MKFEKPAGPNPIDRMSVVGQPHERIEGPLKTTGTAPYAYEHHREVANAAYGYVLGAAIAQGHIRSIDLNAARSAPGVLAIVTWQNAGDLGKGDKNTVRLLGGPKIEHYHQAVAVVVAEQFEQARAAANLIEIDYVRTPGSYDLEQGLKGAPVASDPSSDRPAVDRVGNFEQAFAAAPVQLDATYRTPDESHMMMEPFATTAVWQDDELTLWTSSQMVNWGRTDLATTLNMQKDKIHFMSPYVGGGFGGKLFLRADAVLAALGARASGRPVKLALQRPLIPNNSTHRPATIQRIRIGAEPDGAITAIAHESGSGDQPDGSRRPP